MVRLKHLASLRVECAANGERPYVALENITSWTGSLVEGIDLPVRTPSRTGMASVEPGDVLFGKLRPYLAKTWLVDRPALASTELMCLRPGTGVDSRWLGYLTMATPFVEWAVATSEGTKMPRTSWQKVGEYRPWLPSGSKQRAIADYLDTETGRIDALITKKRRMIELLEERRALVTLAGVSGGLVRRFPRVRSAIHWMTRIPRHWGSPKVGYVASLGSGHTPSRSKPEWWISEECTIPWITTGEVARLRTDRVEFVHQTRERHQSDRPGQLGGGRSPCWHGFPMVVRHRPGIPGSWQPIWLQARTLPPGCADPGLSRGSFCCASERCGLTSSVGSRWVLHIRPFTCRIFEALPFRFPRSRSSGRLCLQSGNNSKPSEERRIVSVIKLPSSNNVGGL